MKRILSIILTVSLVLSLMPFGAITVNAATSGNYISEKEKYTVIFNANGGTNLSAESLEVIENEIIGVLPTVEREGYTFNGWYTAECGGEKVTIDTIITSDTLLYAQWEKSESIEDDDIEQDEDYELIIEDGILTGYTGIPIDVDIPNSVKKIASNSFSSCLSLKSVTLPNSVTEIGEGAFFYCSNLESVHLPNDFVILEDDFFMNGGIFTGCNNLKEIIFNEGIVKIPDCLFYNCTGLESIEIPSTVTEIGGNAFSGCSNLKKIIIPESVTKISGLFNYYNTVIYGKTNSYAESYAEETYMPFVSMDQGYTSANIYPFRIFGMKDYLDAIWVGDKIMLESRYTYEIVDGIENAKLEHSDYTYINFVAEGIAKLKVIDEERELQQIYEFTILPAEEMYIERIVPERIKIGQSVGGYFCKYYNCALGKDEFEIINTNFAEYVLRPDGMGYGGETQATRIHRQKGLYVDGNEWVWFSGSATRAGEFYFTTEYEPDKRYIVVVEKPIITTNLPKQITLGTELIVTTELTNTALENGKVDVIKNKTESSIYYASDLIGYQPRIEIVSGSELVERGDGNYTNILNSEERMKFVGEGTITFRVVYEMLPISNTSYRVLPEDAVYSPETTFTVQVTKEELTQAEVMLSSTSYIYDGSVKEPSIVVKIGNKNLVLGTDYIVNYANNIAVGTATVTVTGKGNYKGTVCKTFTIESADIKDAIVTLSATSFVYDGNAKQPEVTVKLGNKILVSGTDYTVSYANNTETGTATVTINGKGNYGGTVTQSYTIDASLINGAAVSLSKAEFVYDGIAKEPSVTVKLGEKTLVSGTDYTVSYTNNVLVGTATVVISGKGNYIGTISQTYTIIPASLKTAKVTLEKTSYDFDGKVKKPNVSVMVGKKKLVKNADYTVSYKNNKNIGTATVAICGKGNYTGTVKKTFTIKLDKGDTFTAGNYKYKVTGSTTVAFNGIASTKTTKVTIPKSIKYGGKTFKVTSVANKALKGKTKVTEITIGGNVTSVGNSAFEGCKKLNKVTFGSAVTVIEDNAFKSCIALKSITIPSKVTKIDKQAFYGCKNLKSITIKSTKLKTVGKEAFKKINANASIKVPKSKMKDYTKLLKKAGIGSKVKIKKY